MLSRRLAIVFAVLLGAAGFCIRFPLALLSPTFTDWLVNGDRQTHFLGWEFFRHTPWGFPLGHIDNFLYPQGTSIGFTDSIPWLAIFFRVFAGVLPAQFQYFGPWLLSCYVLQAVFAFLLLDTLSYGQKRLLSLAGAAFFVFAPPFLAREGHMALCAQWVILAAFLLSVRAHRQAPKTPLAWAALCFFVAGVHPYLLVMVLAITAFTFFSLALTQRWRAATAAVYFAAVLLAALIAFVACGYLAAGDGGGGGFGEYAADILCFFNSMGWSRILPALPVSGFSGFEGFAYLGAGGILLFLVALVAAKRKLSTAWLALFGACFSLFLFALSCDVHLYGRQIAHLFDPHHAMVWAALRSSGRFAWPLFYFVLALSVHAAFRAPWLLFLALALQLFDISAHLRVAMPQAPPPIVQLRNSAWHALKADVDHIDLYPPYIPGVYCVLNVDAPGAGDPYYPFAFLAAHEELTYNSGYLARVDRNKCRAWWKTYSADLAAGRFAPRTIYIVNEKQRALFSSADCGMLDGVLACVKKGDSNAVTRAWRPLAQ